MLGQMTRIPLIILLVHLNQLTSDTHGVLSMDRAAERGQLEPPYQQEAMRNSTTRHSLCFACLSTTFQMELG
ncbi:hypothetical protein FR483_n071R [Paramecium bursaria Chlorella virus FR483]|uniref:Uncharacterized protein n071R n=1 Tax=Paramecium bursaria Chlorella virus FR483 TaxID=399781 RepID=A7J6C5_PBCVF|nr:hypothetical protein FR483_n071R [Paramecium bursaria Chlorella virus FR483]ABT15356.1 hypothetical protein FR483_n071R [Paramecium bursaria Chlorella virus FR483]